MSRYLKKVTSFYDAKKKRCNWTNSRKLTFQDYLSKLSNIYVSSCFSNFMQEFILRALSFSKWKLCLEYFTYLNHLHFHLCTRKLLLFKLKLYTSHTFILRACISIFVLRESMIEHSSMQFPILPPLS